MQEFKIITDNPKTIEELKCIKEMLKSINDTLSKMILTNPPLVTPDVTDNSPISQPDITIKPPIEHSVPKDFIELESLSDDVNKAWEIALMQEGKILKLRDNKTYSITRHITIEPKLKGIVGNLDSSKRPKLEIGNWEDGFPSKLFHWKSSIDAEFFFVGVDIMYPKGHKIQTRLQNGALYSSEPNSIKSGKFAVISSHTPSDRLSWGLSQFTYSPTGEGKFIDLIAKDIVHNGPSFTQAKINGNNRVRLILEDFTINNPMSKDLYDGKSSIYNPVWFIFKGNVSNNKINLLEGNFNLVKTHHGFEAINIRTVINIGRFVFNVYDDSISNDGLTFSFSPVVEGQEIKYIKTELVNTVDKKRTIVCNEELQPGDITSIGTVIEKQIQNSAIIGYGDDNWPRWAYQMDRDISGSGVLKVIKSTFNLKGIHDIMVAYKQNALFNDRRLTINTSFAEPMIRQSGGIGWTWYFEREIQVFMKNGKVSGFCRNSSDANIKETLGYNIENVQFIDGKGEFQFREPFSDKVILPNDINIYINKLQQL